MSLSLQKATLEFSWFCLGTFSYMGEMNYFRNPEKKNSSLSTQIYF